MRHLGRIVAFVFILGCFSVALAGQGFSASLFKTSTKTVPRQPASSGRIVQQRLVTLDLDLLAAQIHAAAQDHDGARVARSEALPGAVEVDLFSGRSVRLKRSHVVASEDGGVVWTADAPDGGFAVFSVLNNMIVGSIEASGHSYLINPAGNGQHLLKEIKISAYPLDRHIKRPRASRAAPDVTQEVRATTTYVDLLVAYTPGAVADMTAGGASIGQTINRDIAIVNKGMSNSGIPLVIRLAGTKSVSAGYSENTSDPTQPLYDLTQGTNANFPAIRDYRTAVKADLVALYIDQNPAAYCGVAWLNTPSPHPDWAFAVVNTLCLGSVTLAHELGHTMGLYHDRYVEAKASSSVYNYGYVSISGNFRDIMSYNNKCYARLGRDCQLRTYYSNPNKTINGAAAGIPAGQSGAADATRWLKAKRGTVAAFR